MKRKVLYWIGGIGIILIILGAVLKCVVIPEIVKSKVADTIALKPGTEAYERWEKLPVPVIFKVTLFEIVNTEEVLRGETPRVEERGPFVYLEKREKENVVVEEEEDRATYIQRTSYEFSKNLSAESDETILTFINLPALAFAQIQESLPGLRSTLSVLNRVKHRMWPNNTSIFVKARVKDFLFNGIEMLCHANGNSSWENFMWKAMCLAYAYIRPEKLVEIDDGELGLNTFALFKNKAVGLDGPFQVKLGLKEPENIGQIISLNGLGHLPNIWGGDTCNTITGTDSTIFRPFLHDVETVSVFNLDLCRSIKLTYAGESEFKGVPVRRYVAGREVFSSVEVTPENYCFCPRSVKRLTTYGGCLKTGLLDLSSCQGAPVTASYPHMLMADPYYMAKVEGLSPNLSEHQIFVDLEPNTGYPMRGAARGQINAFLKKIDEVDVMKNFTDSIVPIVWIEEGVELSDELVGEVESRLLNLLLIADIVCYVLIGFGLLLFICCPVAVLITKIVKSKRL